MRRGQATVTNSSRAALLLLCNHFPGNCNLLIRSPRDLRPREIPETFLEYDSTPEDPPLFLTLRSRSVCRWISLLPRNYYTSRGLNGRRRLIIDGAGNEGENETIRRFVSRNFDDPAIDNYRSHRNFRTIRGADLSGRTSAFGFRSSRRFVAVFSE